MVEQVSNQTENSRVGTSKERFLAFLIDVLILFSINIVIGVLINLILPSTVSYENFRATVKNISGFIGVAYFVLLTYIYQETIGKKVIGLKVVTINNERPNFLTIFLREVGGKFVSSIVFLLGFIWILFDKNKQGWHDKIAKTLVIKR